MKKIMIIVSILLLSVVGISYGQNKITNHFYYYNGEKYYLNIDTKKIAVTANVNSESELISILWMCRVEQSEISEDHIRSISIPNDEQAASRKNIKTFYTEIETQGNLSESAYFDLIHQINRLPGILIASPCFQIEFNHKFGLSNNFYVKLKDTADKNKLYETASRLKLEVLGANQFMPMWFTVSCSNESGMSVLDAANALFESGDYECTEPAFMMHNTGLSNDTYYNKQWGIKNTAQFGAHTTAGIDIKADTAWKMTKGNDTIKVAVIDHGFERTHSDLDSNNFGNGYNAQIFSTPAGNYGFHGTACAGIVGAEQNAEGITGVAPGTKLVSISISLNNATTPANYAAAIRWAYDTVHAHVLSNSWRVFVPSPMINNAISDALEKGRYGKGCVVVFAAGNDNEPLVVEPARSQPRILAVGALSPCGERKRSGTLAQQALVGCLNLPLADAASVSCDGEACWGSNYGTALDVMGPGTLIATTDNTGAAGYNSGFPAPTLVGGNVPPQLGNNDYTQFFNGTSAATPFVAGVAALVLAVNPGLTVTQVNNVIEQSTQKVNQGAGANQYNYANTAGRPNGGWNNQTGYGLVNAFAAVMLAQSIGCPQDIKVSQKYTSTLVQSSTWIKSIDSTWIDPTLNVKFDANPVVGYISLDTNFQSTPTTGYFLAECLDGCGPQIPTTKQMSVQNVAVCDQYTWPKNLATYLSSGVYTVSTVDTDFILNLTIQNMPDTTYRFACTTYTWPLNSVTYTMSGIYTKTSTNLAGCVQKNILQLTIMGNPPIQYTTAIGGLNYIWSFQGITHTLTASKIDTITATPETGCTAMAITNYTKTAASTVLLTLSPTTICPGGHATISVYNSNVAADTMIRNPGNIKSKYYPNNWHNIIVTPGATTTYTISFQNALGVAIPGSYTITLNVGPALTIITTTTAATICAGSATTLTATGANLYTWMPGSITGNSINVSPSSTTIYTVTGTTVSTCQATATRTITVNPPPVVSITTSQTLVCPTTPTVLTATGANTYSWMPGGGNGATYTVSPATTTTYTVTGTNTTTGCTKTATITITIMNVSTTATQNTICAGGTTILTATGALSYTWMPGGGSGATYTATPLTTTTYTVTGSNGAGCTRTATKTITVNPLPTINTTATPATICAGNTSVLTATGANTYTWQPGSLNGTPQNVSPLTTTIYTVTGTNTINGCTKTATRTVTVNPPLVVSATASQNNICPSTPVMLTATGANTYSWMPGGFVGSSIGVAPSNTTTYTVTGTNSTTGCSKTATVTVNIMTISTTATPSNVCAGNPSVLTATGGLTYTWMPGGFVGSSYTVTPTATTTYTVTASSGSGSTGTGCSMTATRTINVIAAPTSVSVTATLPTVCTGNSTTLTAIGASTYTWLPGNATGTTISVNPLSTTTYTVIGSNAAGCTKTAIITINVMPCSTSVLTLKCYIEGYFNGINMVPVLSNQGKVVPANVCDTVTVELHSATAPFNTLHTLKTVLYQNGNIVCTFPMLSVPYYIAIKHRNALETWSATPVLIGSSAYYDFTIANTQAFGNNMTQVGVNSWAFYSGDLDQNENIDLIDEGVLDAHINAFLFGYQYSDLTGDGNVDLLDAPILENNVSSFIFSAHP